MIELTRLNGTPLVLNSDLIKSAEAAPDTMLTLLTGEKLIVRETPAQVVERMVQYRAQLLAAVAQLLPPTTDAVRLAAATSVAGIPGGEVTSNVTGVHFDPAQRRRRETDEE